MDWGAIVQASARLNSFDDPEGTGDEGVEDIEGPMPFPHYLPGPEAYDRLQQSFMEENPTVWDDVEWNLYLNQIDNGATQTAFDEATERAKLWKELQRPKPAPIEASSRHSKKCDAHPAVVQEGVLRLNELWVPKVEKSWKKAAKWRNRQRSKHDAVEEAGEEVPGVEAEADSLKAYAAPPSVGADTEVAQSQHRRSKDHRPRGRRLRAEAVLVTANTTGSGSAHQLLRALQCRSNEIVAIALQEHWCKRDNLPDFQARALQAGWKTAPVPATLSEKERGPSAGVAVAVPSHIRMAKIPGEDWDCSPARSPGRIAKAWVQAVTPCGLLVISVYLWPSEGLTQRNRELVTTALGEGKAYGGPWIILGDYNVTPEEMRSGLGSVIDRAGGAVWAPKLPTFYPAAPKQPRTIDYAILDTRITGCQLSASVPTEGALQGHRAVEFKIKGRTHNPLYWTLAAPRKLPRAPRCGCSRKPVVPYPQDRVDTVDDRFKEVLKCMEAEICRRNDLVDDEGRPLAAFLGRGNGVAFVQRRAFPPRNAAEVGEASCPATALRWITARATEMFYVGQVAWTGRALSVGQLRQAGSIVQRFRKRFSSEEGRRELGGNHRAWDDLLDRAIRFSTGDDPLFWRELAEAANERAQISGQRAARARRKAWKIWVAKSVEKGGGACHAFVRRQLMAADATVGLASCLDASPQAVVNQDLKTWKAIWERHQGTTTAPWRNHDADEGELPAVTAQCLRRAARSFKESTSIGVDGIPPKTVALLSDELLEVVADLINRIEEGGVWPQSYSTAVLHLIPKPAGGRRPIGLLPTLVRLWERARKDVVRRWRSKEAMPFSWAGKGKGSEAAVWQQSVRAEAATHRGHTTAAMMVDLVKAFESVPLWRVWEAGLRRGLPTRLLRLALEACSFTRRLVFSHAFSEAVESLSAILAGGGMAVDLLALALEETVDEASRLCPAVEPYLVVDDLTLMACGTEQFAVAQVVQAGRFCVEKFEASGMVVSRNQAWEDDGEGKSIALASTPSARKRLATSTRAMGIPVRRKTKNLGVDFGPGSKVGKRTIMLGRWAKARERTCRARKLGKAAAPGVFSTGPLASVRYGSSLTGVTETLLSGIRSVAASTFGNQKGRSTTVRLALRKADLAVPLMRSPVKAWLTAVWDRSLDADTLRGALTAAQAAALRGGNPHAAVQGGAGAYVAALFRVGWRAPSIDVVVDHLGNLIRIGENCDVRMFLRLFEERLAQVLLNLSSVAEEIRGKAKHHGYGVQHARHGEACTPLEGSQLQGKPWLQPVLMAIGGAQGKGADAKVRESLRSYAEGGWWPQARLHSQGTARDPLCQICYGAEGTCLHRLTALHNPELEPDEQEIKLLRYAAQHQGDPLYFRGIPEWPAEIKMPEEDSQVLCREGDVGPFHRHW